MEAEQRPAVEQNGNQAPPPAPPARKNPIQLIQAWPLSRKIATAAVLVISIAIFAILIIQARMADQQLLYANLSMTDAAAVTEWLKGQKIDYSLRNDGKDIWISADKIYQSRLELAASGMPSGGGVGFEIFDEQSFALTDYVQKVNYTRALQGELARTISSLSPVESTRVHLALPERRVFKREQKDATASVIVTLYPGKRLSEEQVQGIINLVAGSVTDLEPDNVKVIDSNGVVLESPKKSDNTQLLSADMLAYQQEVEHRLEIRAQDLLDKTMGSDNAMVRVSATLDFSKVEKTQELFDPEEPVVRSEQITQESSGGPTTGGIPGVVSNLQGNTAGQQTNTPNTNSSSRITNYEISKTVSTIINPIGTITKLSVSVLVADKVEADENGTAKPPVPRTEEELQSIQNMVSSAVGLVPNRGDMINVISMPFVDTTQEQLQDSQGGTNNLYQFLPIVKYILIFLGALLVYFFLIRPIIKTVRGEIKQHNKTVEQLESEHRLALEQSKQQEPEEPILPIDDTITALRREVMQNQVPTAFIIKNWIHEG